MLKIKTIYCITEVESKAPCKALPKIGLDYIEDFKHINNNVLGWYSIKNKKYE